MTTRGRLVWGAGARAPGGDVGAERGARHGATGSWGTADVENVGEVGVEGRFGIGQCLRAVAPFGDVPTQGIVLGGI